MRYTFVVTRGIHSHAASTFDSPVQMSTYAIAICEKYAAIPQPVRLELHSINGVGPVICNLSCAKALPENIQIAVQKMWVAAAGEDVSGDTPQPPSPESWARICQALDKHHPHWIDGNGSAIDKIIKFIEGVKS